MKTIVYILLVLPLCLTARAIYIEDPFFEGSYKSEDPDYSYFFLRDCTSPDTGYIDCVALTASDSSTSFPISSEAKTLEDNPGPAPEDFQIPNVFTPNNDGINDTFEIPGLPGLSSLQIFTRSGKEVFSTDLYMNNWDGCDMAGNTLPEDTYWYILTTPENNGIFKGFVFIKRN